jgi:hypothetical protein
MAVSALQSCAKPSKRMVVASSKGFTLSKVRKKNVRAIGTTQLLRQPGHGTKQQRRGTSRTDNRKHKKQVMVDFNALPQLYAKTPVKSILKNVNGNGGGKCCKQRSAIFYVDPNPPPATVDSDYAGKFSQSVHELGNAVVILCTKEKAHYYEDRAHLTRNFATDTYKFTFAGNKNEYKMGPYNVFNNTSKRVLLFIRKEKNIPFTFYGEVRALSHNAYNHLHNFNPTWLFEFLDNNMPSSAISLLAEVFDKRPPKPTQP